ncbi:hypothetical protein [Myroides marinus]|uniref:hypothetical protein n=1 Tax=Myroides TaxID=76831 RepID=UPI002576DD97|nr:hypothetical protein [Myroides marinus]MDM1378190.1 hypothetical protein [Myroides marinus]MDM1385424.1 hypothetical protein [Myroides marinus]MDM1392637.1 hypothetical protein [Myroides marinus]
MKKQTHYKILYQGTDVPGISPLWINYLERINNDLIVKKGVTQVIDFVFDLFGMYHPNMSTKQKNAMLEVKETPFHNIEFENGSTIILESLPLKLYTITLSNIPIITLEPIYHES